MFRRRSSLLLRLHDSFLLRWRRGMGLGRSGQQAVKISSLGDSEASTFTPWLLAVQAEGGRRAPAGCQTVGRRRPDVGWRRRRGTKDRLELIETRPVQWATLTAQEEKRDGITAFTATVAKCEWPSSFACSLKFTWMPCAYT